jgi:hypothetical protein
MGAWGANSFQNDDAMDWLGDLEREGAKAIVIALKNVPLDKSLDVEAPDASAAIAAAEVIAALNNKPAKTLLPWVAEWIKGRPKPPKGLTEMANAVVSRIISASELRDLWYEADSTGGEWLSHVEDLLSRLS